MTSVRPWGGDAEEVPLVVVSQLHITRVYCVMHLASPQCDGIRGRGGSPHIQPVRNLPAGFSMVPFGSNTVCGEGWCALSTRYYYPHESVPQEKQQYFLVHISEEVIRLTVMWRTGVVMTALPVPPLSLLHPLDVPRNQ